METPRSTTAAFVRLLSVALGLAVCCAAPAARAQSTVTWFASGSTGASGGTGSWDTTALRWTADGSTWSAWSNAGNNTAVFAGTAGTVTLTAPITAGGLTFTTSGYTLTGGTLTLGGVTPTIAVNTATSGSATIASILAGSAGLTKTGTGTLILSGSNTYSGVTTISQGTIVLGTNTALGTSTVTVASGGALDLAGFGPGRNVTLSGTGVTGYALYTSNTTANGGSAIGTLTLGADASLGGSSVYSNSAGSTSGNGPAVNPGGTVDLAGFTLTIGSNGRLNMGTNSLTSGSVNVLTSGIIQFLGSNTLAGGTGSITLNAGAVMDGRDYNNTNWTNRHTIVLAGGTVGNGLAGSNGGGGGATYANNVTVNAGGGTLWGAGSFGNRLLMSGTFTGSGPLTVAGGNGVRFAGDGTLYTGTMTLTSSALFQGNANQTFNGAIIGTSSINKAGSTTTTLGGPISGAGGVTITGGTLALSGSNSATSTTTVSSAALTLDYSTNNNRKAPSGALTLTTGTVNLVGGSFSDSVASTTLTAFTASAINRPSGSSVLGLGAITANAGATLTFGTSGIATTTNTGTFGILGPWATIGTADWAALSSGTVVLPSYADVTRLSSGSKTISTATNGAYRITEGTGSTGSITLASATTTIGTLNQSAQGGSGAATIDPAGQTLQVGGIMVGSGAGSLTIGTGVNNGIIRSPGNAITFRDLAGAGITVNSVIANGTAGASTLTKYDTSLLTLTGTNTYTGASTILSGTLQIGGSGQLGGGTYTAGVTLANGAVLQYSSSAAQAISGTISGTGSLIKDTGTGTLSLSAANTFTGTTTVNAGVLDLTGGGGGPGTIRGTLNINSGAQVRLSSGDNLGFNTDTTAVRVVNITGGTLTSSAGSNQTTTGTFNLTGGVINGTVNVDLFGNTAAINTLASSATSTISVTSMNLRQDNTAFTIADGAATIDLVVSSNLGDGAQGNHNLIKAGAGTMLLSGSNSYSGTTRLSAGTLLVGSTNALGNGTGGLAVNAGTLNLQGFSVGAGSLSGSSGATITSSTPGGTLTTNVTTTSTYAGVITGTMSLVKAGSGPLTLSGSNTFTGTTTVNSGTLVVGNKNAFGTFVAGRPVTQVVVNAGGAIEFNGVIDATYGYTISGSGATGAGALVNTGAAIPTGNAQTSNIRLAANASIGGSGDWALLTNGYAATTLDLGGFTLTKTGANTINLANTTITNTGTIAIQSGTIALFNTGATGTGAEINLANAANAGLNLASLNLTIGALSGGGSTGGNVTLGSGGLTVGSLGTSTSYGGAILGTGPVTKTGAGTLSLSGTNAYSGATTISAGGVTLTGASGVIASSTSVAIASGATLSLVNTAAANNTNRLSDSAPIALGGTLVFSNDAGAANFSETAGALTVATVGARVVTSQAASGSTSTLTFASLTRTGSTTIDFSGTGLGADTRNRILFTSSPTLTNGMIGVWATYNGSGWATYGVNGVQAYAGYTNVNRLGGTITSSTSSNVQIVDGGSSGNVTMAATGTTDIYTLVQTATAGVATVDLSTSNVLRLAADGGILVSSTAAPLTITGGTLTAGGAANTSGTITLTVPSATGTATLASVLANNGSGALGLTTSGSGTVVLSGTNRYSGPTTVLLGTLSATSTANLASGSTTITAVSPGVVSIDNAGAAQTFSNAFAGSGTVNFAATAQTGISGNWSGFTGTLNVNTSGSGKLIDNAGLTVPASTATINVPAGATFYMANSKTFTNTFLVTGTGNTEGRGAMRIDAGTISGTVVLTGTATFGNSSGGTGTISGLITGSGVFATATVGNGTINLSTTGSNSYTGGTIVNAGSQLSLGSGGTGGNTSSATALGSGPVLITSGATLRLWIQNSTTFTIANAITLDNGRLLNQDGNYRMTGGITVNTSGTLASVYDGKNLYIDAPIVGSGSISVGGVQNYFTAVNTYTGPTAITSGLLGITGSGQLGSGAYAGNISIANGATLSITSTAGQTLSGSIANAGTMLFNTTANQIVSGTITGAGALTKLSTGTLTLTGTNSYSGLTTGSAGVLAFSSGSSAITGNLFVAGSGTVQVSGGYVSFGANGGTPAIYATGGLLQVTGGTLASPGWLSLGNNTSTTGTLTQTGGLLSLSGSSGGSPSDRSMAIAEFASTVGSYTLSGGTLTTANAVYVGQTGTGTWTINGSGSASVAKVGVGFTAGSVGTLNLDGGTLAVGAGGIIGSSTSTFNFNGGTLRATANNAAFMTGLTNAYVRAGGALVDTSGFDVTVSQSLLTTGTDVGGLTKLSGGTLTLTGSSTYTGATTVSGGTLRIGAGSTAGDIRATSAFTVGSGAALAFNRSDAYGGAYSQAIGGAGGVVVSAGTLSLTGSSAYSGGTTLSAGVLRAGNDAALGSGTVTLNAGTLSSDGVTARTLANAFVIGGNVSLGDATNSGTLTMGAGGISLGGGTRQVTTPSAVTFAGTVTNGGLTKLGTGTLTLSSSNSYAGGTLLSAGNLILGNVAALGTGTVTYGGSLGVSLGAGVTGTIANAFVLNSAVSGTFDTGANAATLTGGVSGSGTLVKVGSGLLSISGSNAYSGGTQLAAGGVSINNVSGLGSGTISFTGASSLQTAVSGTLANAFTVATSVTGTIDTQANAVTLAGAVGGSGGIAKVGVGTLTLSANNTFAGGLSIASGTVIVGASGTAGTLGSGDVTNAGTLVFNRSDAYSYGGLIGGAGNLVQAGSGTTTLGGLNTYSGPTSITGGVLSVSQDANLGTAPGAATPGSLVINGGALSTSLGFTLAATRGIALGPATGSGTGTINVAGGQTLTYGGVIADNGVGTDGLVKSGLGTLALSGTATYSGNTSVNAGTLQVTGSLASPNVTVFGNATLAGTGGVNATTVADGGLLSPGVGGAGTLTLSSLAFSGSSTISMTAQGSAPATLLNVLGNVTTGGGANSVTFDFGSTLSLINTGTYQLLAYGGTQLADVSAFKVTGNSGARQGYSVLNATQSVSLVISNAFPIWSGTAGSDWSAADNWVLSSDGSPTSFLPNDTVVFDDSGATGAVTLSQDVAPATTTFSGTTLAYTLSGGFGITTGALVKSGPATLTISTSNSFSGGTTLTAGTIQVGNDAAFGTGAIAVSGTAAGITVSSDGGSSRTVANSLQLGTGVTLGDATNTGALSFTGTVNLGAGAPTITTPSNVTLSGLVTNGGFTKAGAGVLSITGSNDYAGGTTLSAGTILVGNNAALGAGGVTLGNGVTLASTSAAARTLTNAFTLNGDVTLGDATNTGALTLGSAGISLGNGTRQVTTPSDVTFAGVVTSGGLAKAGAGTLTLSTANSYAAGTTLSAGAIALGNTGALGSGTLTVAGNTVVRTALTGTIANAVVLNPTVTGTFDAPSGSATYSGAFSGSGGFAKTGAGTVTLTGTSTYAGNTTIAAGVLQVGGAGLLGGGSYAGAISNSGTLAITTSAAQTLSGTLSGAGTLTKSGAGTLTLTNASNSFSGGSTITGGVLSFTNGALGSTGAVTVAGGTLQWATGNTQDVSARLTLQNSATATLDTNGNVVTLASGFGAGTSGAVLKSGLGTLVLTGSNGYTGLTTVSSGTLQLGAGGSTGSIAGDVANAATLAFSRGDAASYAGVISGTGTLVNLGSGTVTLTGSSTFTGPVTISNGVLAIGGAGRFGSGGTYAGAIANAGGLLVNTSAAQVLSGAISGTGFLTKAGTGLLTLSGSNTYSGVTTVSGGTLAVSADANLGAVPGSPTAGSIVLSGGALSVTTGFTLSSNRGIALGATTGSGSGTIDVAANQTLLYGGVIADNGSGIDTLLKTGAGTLTLTGSNTYSGGTTLSGGTLQIGSGGTAGSIAGNVANAGALVFNRSDALTFGGTISGTGTLTKLGAGTLTLTAANTLTGTTTITSGTLELGTGGNLAGPVANAAALQFNRSDAFTFGSVVSGSGVVRQVGSGTTTLSGANSYTGGTVITAGAISVAAANNLGSGTAATALSNGGRLIVTTGFSTALPFSLGAGGGVLQVNSGQTFTETASSPILTSGTLTKEGPGTLVFSGYSGASTAFNSSSLNVVSGSVGFNTGRFNGNIGLSSITIGTGAVVANNAAHGLGGYQTASPAITINGGTFTLNSEQYLTTMTLNSATINGGNEVRADLAGLLATANSGTSLWSANLSLVYSGTLSVASGAELRLSGGVTNSGAFTKSGPGLLVLSGNNSYSAGTTITGGILEATSVADAGGTGSIGTGALTLSGGMFRYAAAGSGSTSRTVTNSAADGGIEVTNAAAVLSLTGAFNGNASRTLTKSGSGSLVYAGASTIPNAIAITGGTFQVGNGGTGGGISGNVSNGGTLVFNRSNAVSYAGSISGTGALIKLGSNTLTLGGSSSYSGGTDFTAGTISFAANGLGTGTVSMRGGTLQWASGNTQDISGQLLLFAATAATLDTNGNNVTLATGFGGGTSASLVKTGAGALALTASNSFTGGVSVSGGALWVGNDAALGSGAVTLANGVALSSADTTARAIANAIAVNGNVTLGDATNTGPLTFTGSVSLGAATRTLTTPSNVTIAAVVSGAGGLTKAGAGALTLSASNAYVGDTTINAGTLALSGAGDISAASAAAVVIAANAGLDISAASGLRTIGALSGGDATSQVILGGNTLRSVVGGYQTFGGVISGSGGFTKAGGDTLELTSIQSFAGPAIVEAGRLLLGDGGALAAASRIYIESGASVQTYLGQALTVVANQTLGGYGTVDGDLSFASGGILSPGGSVGTLANTTGNTTFNGGMRYLFEVNNAEGTPGIDGGWDLFTTSGALSLAITGTDQIFVDLTSLAGTSPGQAANFDPTFNYAWKFVVAGSTIGYEYALNPTWFNVQTGNFQNTTNGNFYVARGDQLSAVDVTGGTANELYVVYAAIPEPSTLALAGIGLAAAGWAASRRRRRRTH